MYVLLTMVTLIVSLFFSLYVYKNNKYFDNKYLIEQSEKESMKNISIYYSIKKGLYELSSFMTAVVFIILYMNFEMHLYITDIEEYAETQLKFLLIVGGLFVITLIRSLFILNYKLLLTDNKLIIRNGIHETNIELSKIKKVDLLNYHIVIELENKLRLYMIPLGFKNIHIIYRILQEVAEYNELYKIKNKN